MNNTLRRRRIGEEVYFSSVTDPKFKHNRISVNYILPLEKETVSANALIPFLLRKGSRECPDFTLLNQKLYSLYGATLSADVSKYGGYQGLDVSISGLDDKFTLDGEAMVAQCAGLLAGLATDPNLVDGAFPEKDVELEKQYLIDSIEAEINDKRAYAINKCRTIMCEGEPAALRKYGYVEDVKKITPQSAAETFLRVRRTARVEILFVGCGDCTPAEEIMEATFAKLDRAPIALPEQVRVPAAAQVKQEVERMDLSQSKLAMGFRTGAAQNMDELSAMRLMVAMFGGTPFSRLFVNVREKLSLCYYCAARFDRITGIMLVDSGVEAQNREKAQAEILNQLEVMKRGGFTDEELENTLLTMKNSLYTVSDSLSGLEDWYMAQLMQSTARSLQEEAELMAKVTREDVMAAAQKVTLDTVYFLTGEKED